MLCKIIGSVSRDSKKYNIGKLCTKLLDISKIYNQTTVTKFQYLVATPNYR